MILLSIFDAASLYDMVYSHLLSDGYLWVFLFMVIESSFIPFPSEIVVPPAAYVACQDGADMTVVGVGVAATAGALVGSIVNYLLSVWIGRPLVYKFAGSRLGSVLMVTPDKVKRSEDYFAKHGGISTFIGRLIPVIRQLISIPAGLSRMNFGKFCLFTSAGAAIWNVVLCWLGVFLSGFVKPDDLRDKVEYYNEYLSYAGYAIGLICVGYIIWKVVRHKKESTSTVNEEKI